MALLIVAGVVAIAWQGRVAARERDRARLEAARAERVAELVLTEFNVPWLRLRVNKEGAVRGARDVGIVIERELGD